MTIHRIGKKPNAAPSVPASRAWPTGISKSATATTSATPSEISPATQALSLSPPRSTKSAMQRQGSAQGAERQRVTDGLQVLLEHATLPSCQLRAPTQSTFG